MLTADLTRVRSIVTANDAGVAEAEGLRAFRLVEDGEPIERNRVMTALTQDEQQVAKLQGELNLISAQIKLVRNLAESAKYVLAPLTSFTLITFACSSVTADAISTHWFVLLFQL